MVAPELLSLAREAGLSGETKWTPLSGGVSCDVWRVEGEGGVICVKRALPALNVAADWRAPVRRALYEARWFETANAFLPGCAPRPLALDAERGLLAMTWLDPPTHPLWKARLLAGEADPAAAGAVGERLGRVHAAAARRPDLAGRFDSGEIFHALRLDPYLLAAARRRPEVAAPLHALAERTGRTHLTLVHGDVSPKNILLGPDGPVFLDAETACWGDPAFDLAFCLNHLLLKHLAAPGAADALGASFAALSDSYRPNIAWEEPDGLERRAASLLPGLMLARADGKSPVEYLSEGPRRDLVRRVAIPLLLDPPASLAEVLAAWRRAF